MDLISEATERLMKAAVEEVEASPHYMNEGEVISISTPYCEKQCFFLWVINDARHDSTQQCQASLEGNDLEDVPNTSFSALTE